MSGFRIEGNSGIVAEVNSRKEVTVNLPTDLADQAGYAIIMCESDPGTKTGEKYVKSPECSEDYRMRVGIDTLLFTETFNYSAQNTATFAYRNTTQTITWNTGYILMNATAGNTTGTGCEINTWRTFSIYGAGATYAEMTLQLANALPTANFVFDTGLFFLTTGATPYAPTDGAYFRITDAGVFGVLCYAGAGNETVVDLKLPVATFDLGVAHKMNLSIDERHTEFWIDDVLYAEIETPAGKGQPMSSSGAPWAARLACTGSGGTAMQVKISDVTVSMGDWHTSKTWAAQNCGQGLCAYQGQSGGTMGTTANHANNTNPTPIAGSNTAAGFVGLGGWFAVNAAVPGNDLIMTSFSNPTGGSGQTPRVLYITGCKISSVNMGAAVATSATAIAWSIAFGHTSASMAQAEGAAGKAPRRIAMGIQTWQVGATIGSSPDRGDLYMKFDSPIVVNPGEYIASVVRFIVGTATASQAIWGHVTFDGYYA